MTDHALQQHAYRLAICATVYALLLARCDVKNVAPFPLNKTLP